MRCRRHEQDNIKEKWDRDRREMEERRLRRKRWMRSRGKERKLGEGVTGLGLGVL